MMTVLYLLFQKSHMSTKFGMEIYLKNDFLQHTGRYVHSNFRLSSSRLSAKLIFFPSLYRVGLNLQALTKLKDTKDHSPWKIPPINQLTSHSFKERGARNALLLLSAEAKQRGVISASLGNHSQALSYHAKHLNIPTTVVMPNVAPIMKIQKCRSFGANVIIHGDGMKEAKFHAMMVAKEKNLTYING